MIERTLLEYYRCPPEFVKMSPAGPLSSDSGYFRFGTSVCYGRSAYGSRVQVPSNDLYDILPTVIAHDEALRVPFDVSEVVDNLRLERYANSAGTGASRHAWHRPYYSLRRFIPLALRQRLQRRYFRDWKTLAFPRWPVDASVDQLLEQLLVLMLRSQGMTRLPFVWFWPHGAPSCAIVTHDIETEAGRDRCSWLMDEDDRYQIKASFQIVPEERYAVPSSFLEEIRVRDFEINVHDLNHDGRLFASREEFIRRAERINGYLQTFGARGFRSGGLYRHPDWYGALQIDYDMSIPNAAHLEIQRGGCCTVMPYFIGPIIELPVTTTQDYSLFHILRDFSNDVWKNQIESVIGRHGLLSFIVHPDYLGQSHARQAYRMLLDQLAHLREAGRCWITLPGEVERWWRERSQMTLVREGDHWRIEGTGKERARIAFAEVDGDDLIYRVTSSSWSGDDIS